MLHCDALNGAIGFHVVVHWLSFLLFTAAEAIQLVGTERLERQSLLYTGIFNRHFHSKQFFCIIFDVFSRNTRYSILWIVSPVYGKSLLLTPSLMDYLISVPHSDPSKFPLSNSEGNKHNYIFGLKKDIPKYEVLQTIGLSIFPPFSWSQIFNKAG